MSLNVQNLILSITQKIGNTTNEEELNTLTKVLSNLKGGMVYSIDTFNNLPSASENTGILYFIEDEELVYWSTGTEWTSLYTFSNNLYGWGSNFFGQLGNQTTISFCSPTQEITSSTDWCQVSGGDNHSLALKTSGILWTWGFNSNGELGDGTTICRSSPVQEVISSTDWCQVSGGSAHSLAIKNDGTAWGWGLNNVGQIGDGTVICRSSPVQEVTSSTDWCQVSGGGIHSIALKTNNTLWSWGNNFNGQLGRETISNDSSSPVQEITSSTDWCQVSGGDAPRSLALKTSGTLWGWGENFCGELGDGTIINRSSPVQEATLSTDWCQVYGSSNHSLALKTSGTLWAWGSNYQPDKKVGVLWGGNLGDGTIINRSSPVQEITSSTDWCQVYGGEYFSLALKTSGQIWGWGRNNNFHLGDGTNICRSSPVQEVTSSTNWCQVSGGNEHSLAIKVE